MHNRFTYISINHGNNPMKKLTIGLLAIGMAAIAYADNNQYWVNGDTSLVLDSNGQCIRSATWTETSSCTMNEPVVVVEPPVELQPQVAETKIFIKDVYFDFDQSDINSTEQIKLGESIVTAMQFGTIVNVEVGGYTDNRGAADYNYALSNRRIQSVVDYLASYNIATDSKSAWGELEQVRDAEGNINDDLSRRVEIRLTVQVK
jgi:outer membrane protein OmpA-like peptidoglycan-associated protein